MTVPLRVLLVEDSDDDAELVLRELRKSGYELETQRVQTPRALEAALDRPWDIVISDYSMPSFDGLAALQLVRARDTETPFIMVSGTIGEDVAVKAMRAGINDYVLKTNLARLPAAVEREVKAREGRRRSAHALGESDARWQVLVSQLPAVSWTVNQELQVTWMHGSGVLANLGVDPERFVGQSLHVMLGDPSKGSRPYMAHVAAIEGESTGYRYQARDRVFESHVQPLRGPEGDITGAIGVSIDVTDRVKLEQQLRAAQKLESLGRLAGGIAHDFNNLLMVIGGTGTLARQDVEPGSSLDADLKAIEEASERGAALTRQLLTFARRSEVQLSEIDPESIVVEVASLLGRVLGDTIELQTQCAITRRIRADPGQIEQVLMNLAVNARDAMPDGGALTLECVDTDLADDEVDGLDGGRYVSLRVSDTGIGMDLQTRERAFEPFFTTKPPGSGTGLGLSTVYGIVRQGGGVIRVESEPGNGTTIDVVFPEAAPSAGSAPVPPVPEEARGGSETILVVDDDTAVRGVAARILEREGYRVIEANEGEQARRLWEEDPGRVDLVLTDVVMPRMSGPELVDHVQRDGQPPCIFMSGHGGDLLPSDGEHMLLNKPFTSAALLRAVRRLLDQPRT